MMRSTTRCGQGLRRRQVGHRSGPEGIPTMNGDDGEDDEDDEDFEPAIEEEDEFDDADMEMDDDGDLLKALAAEAEEAAATETAKEAAAEPEEAAALEEARSLPIADFKDLDALMCAALRLLRACTGAGGMAAPSTHGCSQARRHTCQDKQSLHLRSLWRCRCAICVHCVQGALLRTQEVPVCDQAHPRRFVWATLIPCGVWRLQYIEPAAQPLLRSTLPLRLRVRLPALVVRHGGPDGHGRLVNHLGLSDALLLRPRAGFSRYGSRYALFMVLYAYGLVARSATASL